MLTLREQVTVVMGRIDRRLKQAQSAQELMTTAIEDVERETAELHLLLEGQQELPQLGTEPAA